MFGIIVSRGFRKYASRFSDRIDRPPLKCYAGGWWRELVLNGSNDVCDCKIWCKYPVTKRLKRN